jgi:hypothetical protein
MRRFRILVAVWLCFQDASGSARSMASMPGLWGSSFGEVLYANFHGGGSVLSRAWRTVAMHVVALAESPARESFDACVAADGREEFHS